MGEATFNAAQAHDDIVARADRRGRLAGVLIRQRADKFVRELRFNRGGDLVDEPDDRAGFAALAPGDGLAGFACTRAVPVVLRNVVDAVIRIFPHDLAKAFGQEAQHVRVGKTQLRPLVRALALDEAVILRMGLEEFGRRQERKERVNAPIALQPTALLAPAHRAIDPIARRPDGVERLEIKIVADAQTRLLRPLQIHETPRVALWRHGNLRRVPAHAQFVLEEGHHSIHCAPLPSAVDHHRRADVLVSESLVVIQRRSELRAEKFAGARVGSDDDLPPRRAGAVGDGELRSVVRDDGKIRPADLFQPVLKFLRGPVLRIGSLRAHDDGVVGLPVAEQRVLDAFASREQMRCDRSLAAGETGGDSQHIGSKPGSIHTDGQFAARPVRGPDGRLRRGRRGGHHLRALKQRADDRALPGEGQERWLAGPGDNLKQTVTFRESRGIEGQKPAGERPFVSLFLDLEQDGIPSGLEPHRDSILVLLERAPRKMFPDFLAVEPDAHTIVAADRQNRVLILVTFHGAIRVGHDFRPRGNGGIQIDHVARRLVEFPDRSPGLMRHGLTRLGPRGAFATGDRKEIHVESVPCRLAGDAGRLRRR